VVAAFGVDGEGADDFAGGGVDDSYVEVVDEQDDAGSVEGSSEAHVVHLAVDAQADVAVGDAVVADAELGVEVVLGGAGGGAGFRAGVVGAFTDGRRRCELRSASQVAVRVNPA